MTTDELEAAQAGGQSLSEIIEQQGVDAATLQANAPTVPDSTTPDTIEPDTTTDTSFGA